MGKRAQGRRGARRTMGMSSLRKRYWKATERSRGCTVRGRDGRCGPDCVRRRARDRGSSVVARGGGTAHLASRLSVVRVGAGASGDRAEVEVARAGRVAELEVDAVLGEDLPTRVACVRRQSGRDERVRAHQKVVGEPDKVAAALVDILGVKVNASGETIGDKAELGRLQSVPRERKQQDGDEEDGEAAARGGLAPGHAAHVAVVAAGILWGGRACV